MHTAAVQVLHDQEQRTGLPLKGIDRNNVRVVQAGCQLRLADEAFFGSKLGERIGVKLLDGNQPFQLRILRFIDNAKTAVAYHVEDAELVQVVVLLEEHSSA